MSEIITYEIKVEFFAGEDEVNNSELKKNIKARLADTLPAQRGEARVELFSLREE